MSKAKKFLILFLVGVWIIQAVSCNPSSDTSTGESEAEQTLQSIYAEDTAQFEAAAKEAEEVVPAEMAIQPSPTPLPTPRPNGELLFSDDCDSSGGAQGMFKPELMNFSYQNGKCRITANSNGYVLPAMYDAPILEDFILEYDLEIISAKPDCEYSVIFRSDDVPGGLSEYYYVALKPVEEIIEFSVWKEIQWVFETKSDIPQGFPSSETPIRVRLEVMNDEFRVFLDGIFVTEFQDDRYSSPGIFGISITSSNAPETFEYDNLQVYDIGP